MEPERYRDLFPILRTRAHLGNCSQGPLSIPVMEALEEYERTLIEVGMDWAHWMEEVRRAKRAFASLIGAQPDDVAVVSCLSDAVSAIASCLPIEGRDGVVATADEFPTVGHAWLASERRGRAQVTFVEAEDGRYTPDLVLPALDSRTAILSTHFVSYYRSVRQDLRPLADAAHEAGAVILVDAYQGLGTVPLDVGRSDLDIVASGNLKYLLGLPGIAFMYVRPELSERLEPAMTGWFGRANPFSFAVKELDYAPGAARFDMGTPPIPAAYAARAGMELIARVGVEEIHRHVQRLSRVVIEGAVERGFEVVSPTDVQGKGASTAIRVGPRSAEIERAMLERGTIVSARGDVIRIAPHFFTLEAECIRALDGLSGVLEELDVRAPSGGAAV